MVAEHLDNVVLLVCGAQKGARFSRLVLYLLVIKNISGKRRILILCSPDHGAHHFDGIYLAGAKDQRSQRFITHSSAKNQGIGSAVAFQVVDKGIEAEVILLRLLAHPLGKLGKITIEWIHPRGLLSAIQGKVFSAICSKDFKL